jgi:hypothetical protein
MPTGSFRQAAVVLPGFFYALAVAFLLAAAWRGANRASLVQRIEASETIAEAVGAGGGLLVVFRPEDCADNVRFIRSWQTLEPNDPVPVIAVPLMGRAAEAWKARAVEDLMGDYPQRPELEASVSALLRGMPGFNTPAAMLFDGRGRVRLVVPALADPRQIQKSHESVLAYMEISRTNP